MAALLAPSAILVEACVQTVAGAVSAAAVGADRLELCADLSRGGVTPSADLMRVVRTRVGIPLQVLIRPRAGDFVYDDSDIAAMLFDIREARRAGADGVVLGALTREHTVDREVTARLIAAARPLSVTFHRAIDQTPDLGAAVTTLIELGIERVLTSGGAKTAEQGTSELTRLVRSFGASIAILAGGSVRQRNALRICGDTGVREVHLGPRLDGTGEFDAGEFGAVVRKIKGL
jgi:copper homeostasis protein